MQAWDVPPLFQLLQERGHIAREEMFRAFNMGIGLVDRLRRRASAERVIDMLARAGEPARGPDRVRRLRQTDRSLSVRSDPPRLGVLISGRGSNLQSIIDAIAERRLDATLAVVISNRADAAGLHARARGGIETVVLNPRDYADRTAYDAAIADTLSRAG